MLTSTITEALQRYTHRRVDDPHRVWNYDRGQLQQAQPSAVPGRTVAVADRSPDFRKYHHRSQPPSTVDNPFQPRPSASTFSAAEWTPVVPLPKGLFSDLEQRDRAPQWSWVRGPSSAVSFEAPPMTADDKGRRDRNHHYDLDVSFNDSKGDSYRNHQPPPRANASVPVEQQRQHYDSDPTAYYYRPHDGYQNVKTRAEELLRQTKGRPQADANTNGEITTLNFGGVTNSRPQNVNAVIEIENERPRVYYDKTVNIIPSFDDDSRHKHQNYVHAPGGKKNDYYSHFANTNLNEKNVEENQRLNVEKTAENQVVSSYNHDVNANGSDEGFEFQNTNVNNGTSDHRRQHSYFDFHAESADTKGTRQIGYSGAAAKTNSWLYPTQTHHANSIDQKVENNHHRSNNYYHQHGSVDDAETTDRENDRDRGAIGADSNGKFHNYEDSVNSIGKLNNYEVSETSNGGDEDDSTTTGKIHRRIVSTRTGQEDGKDRQAALQDTERRRRRRPLTVAAASNSTDVPKLSDEAAASRQRRRRVQTSTRRPPVAVEENTAGDSQHGYGERLVSMIYQQYNINKI